MDCIELQKIMQRQQNKIARQIQIQYNSHFHSNISDDFEAEDYEEFVSAAQSVTANDYESLILDYLGKQNKYRKFIEYLKNSTTFQNVLLTAELKPIYELPHAKIDLGKNTNLIYTLPLNPYIEWNLDSIIQQVGTAEAKLLRSLMKMCRTFEEFIEKIQDYFLDFCIRKLDVSELVFNINMLALQSQIEDRGVKQILRELTCPDFLRLYSHFYRQKSYFGYILSRLSLPLPILFTSKSQKGKIQFFHPQILNTIILQNDYILITSIGSNKMKGKGKTNFLKKFFLLKDKTLSTNKSSFHDGSIDFYTRVPHKINGKDVIIADFHGDLKQGSKYRQLLRKCINVASIIFIHVNQREINNQIFQNSSFLKQLDALQQSLNKQAIKILIGRDCRVGQDQLFDKLGIFNLIRLPNLNDQQQDPTISLRIDRIYKYIQEQSQHNVKSTFIEPSAFLSGQALQDHRQNQREVQYIMSILLKKFEQNRDNFYESIFPNLDNELKKLYLRQKIIKYQAYLKQQIEEQCRQMLKDYNESKQTLQKLERSNQKPKSYLIEETVRLLEQQGKFKIIYLLSDKLSTWREKEAEKYIEFIIAKNAQYSNLNKSEGHKQEKQALKNIIKEAQQNLQKYDISVDTIFSQLISSMKKTQTKMFNDEVDIVFKYYDEAYQNLNPINLIEGKTLSYGNPFIQNFIEELHKLKYSKKKVFVVSIIGAQSSAKSTILNYIFRCNFATSVGRCTKGVYLTIVECEQKVIAVIDTQGLLSVAARDHTFDVQIACFVMLVSDLVIINNKGEVNAVLRDLLGVCIYAIDQLNAIEMGSPYQPNRVIFTIRDQVEYGGNKQTEMLAAIIRSLDQNARVNYRNYIDFSQKDIYPLQSAFVSNNTGSFCIQSASNSFGKSIVSLRARILQMLKTPKNQSLIQFYHNAKIRWQSIQNCGENIFNFKNIYQIKSKQQIKAVLQKVKKQYCGQFLDKQKLIIQAYQQSQLLQKQIDIQQQLKAQYFKFKQQVLQIFNLRCEQKVNQKQFIKDYQHEIQQFCTIMYRDSIQKFKRLIQERRIESQNEHFKSQIRQNIKSSYSNGKLDKDIIVQYQQLRRQLVSSIQKDIQTLQAQYDKIGRNQISLHITTKIDNFRQDYYNQMNIQYHNLNKLNDQYLQIQNYKSRKSPKLIDMYIIKDKKFIQANITPQDIQLLTMLICQFLNQCQQSINRCIKDDFQACLEKIEGVVVRIVHLINDQFHKFNKQTKFTCQKYQIKLQHKGIVVARFLSSLPLKFQKNYFDISKINLQNKLRRQDEEMRQLIEQLKTSYKIRGSNKEIGKVWIKKILDRQLDRFLLLHQTIIQKELNQICSIINPRNIIQMAFKSLNSSQIRSKQRWLQCFKIVKNTNRCLKEYLYQRPQFKDLNQKLYKVQNDLKDKMSSYLKSKLRQEVQTIISSKLQSTIEVESDGEPKGIEYYQAVFGIDLFAYKKDDIPPRLLDILICILETVRNLQANNAQYQYFNQHVINQLKDKMQKLKKHIQVFNSQVIEPNVVGCQARCPGCGMKCYKSGDHVDGHALMKQTHLMECFSGKVYHEDGVRSKDMCFTADSIIDREVFLPEKDQRVPLLTYIQERYPQWYQHYLDKASYNSKSREKQCNVIWANIQYVIIRYKFREMRPDISVRKYQYDPLEDQDVLRLQLEEY